MIAYHELLMSNIPPPPPLSPPPGYVPYGAPGAAGGSFQNVGGLAKALVILTAIGAALGLALVGLGLNLRDKADDSLSVFEDSLGPYVLVGLLGSAVGLAALVIRIIWTYRMAQNLRTLRRDGQSFGPGATIAINILGDCTLGILPFFMWRELWKGSNPETPAGDTNWKQGAVGGIVIVSFVLQLAALLSTFSISIGSSFNAGLGTGKSSDLAEQFRDDIGATATAGVLGTAAAVVFILVIRQLTDRHMQSTGETAA